MFGDLSILGHCRNHHPHRPVDACSEVAWIFDDADHLGGSERQAELTEANSSRGRRKRLAISDRPTGNVPQTLTGAHLTLDEQDPLIGHQEHLDRQSRYEAVDGVVHLLGQVAFARSRAVVWQIEWDHSDILFDSEKFSNSEPVPCPLDDMPGV